MAHLLNIQSSPRRSASASITIADTFIDEYLRLHPETTVDRLNVWEENLPEFDEDAIGAKYKAAAGHSLAGPEAEIWQRIQSLAERFHKADRIVLGVPMWNFAYPYKLKQLIDLVSQRNLLFRFDGKTFSPMLETPKALVVYAQGQTYAEDSPTPASHFNHQTPYIEFWLHFIGIHDVIGITISNTWSEEEGKRLTEARQQAHDLAQNF